MHEGLFEVQANSNHEQLLLLQPGFRAVMENIPRRFYILVETFSTMEYFKVRTIAILGTNQFVVSERDPIMKRNFHEHDLRLRWN